MNCYDLATGRILWRVPLGELEELTRQGVPLTGSQNLLAGKYRDPSVTRERDPAGHDAR